MMIALSYLEKAIYTFAYNAVEDESIIYLIFFIIFNGIYILIQCIEEICLLIMSKDFRKLVKKQFARNTPSTVVAATVYVPQTLQQQMMRRLNAQN